MQIEIRRSFTITDRKFIEAGRRHSQPLLRVTCALVVANPYAGRYVEDLAEMIAASEGLGEQMGAMLVDAMGGEPVEGYGKGGVVGLGGELEHANALLTTTFANPVRAAIGGALAWIPSFTKRAAPGAAIDVPMAHKDALYVRSHYDGMSITLPSETPDADEVVLLFCAASRGRLNARVGGLAAEAISNATGFASWRRKAASFALEGISSEMVGYAAHPVETNMVSNIVERPTMVGATLGGQGQGAVAARSGAKAALAGLASEHGFTPLEFMDAALSGCLVLSLRIAARKFGWLDRLVRVDVEVAHLKAHEPPSRVASFTCRFDIDGDFSPDERAQLIAEAHRICTVGNTFEHGALIHDVETTTEG